MVANGPAFTGTGNLTLIKRFMEPAWGHSGANRAQMGPIWPHELCYLGNHATQTVCIHSSSLERNNALLELRLIKSHTDIIAWKFLSH